MAQPLQTQSIPLGGTDAAGNALPAEGQFLAPADQSATGTGSPWATYAPPEPAAPAAATGTAAPAADQPSNVVAGPWASFAPKEKPPKTVTAGDAATLGIADALSFDTAPNIMGLAAASGKTGDQAVKQESDTAEAAPAGAEALGGAELAKPLMGAAKMLHEYFSDHPDPSIVNAYEQGRQEALENRKLAQSQHGAAYLAGQVGGTIATLPFTGGVGAGAKAATMGGRILQGVKTGGIGGALFGGGEALSEGGDVADVTKGAAGGAAVGAALGGVTGSAIEGVTNVGKKIASVVRGARDEEGEAGTKVLSALSSDQPQVTKNIGDNAALDAGSQAGTPVYLADMGGENTRALLRSSANVSPTARNIINEKLDSRYRQQADRFSGWIRSKFGGHDKDADIDAIRALADKENDPAYARAYHAGSKGVWTPELQRLSGTPSIQEAIRGAVAPMKDRGIIAGYKLPRSNPFRPNPQKNGAMELRVDEKGNSPLPELAFWDQIVRNLNGRIGKLLREGNDTRARDVIQLKNALTKELDERVPAYKDARAGAASFFKAEDAVEAGANFVKDGSITTAQGARAFGKFGPAQKELFRRGFAAELANQIERNGFRSDVLNNLFVASPRAVQRIKIALGNEGADQFEALMRIEGIINKTRLAMGNSTTVRQSHEAGMAAGAVGLLETLHGALNPAYIIAGALVVGGRQGAKHIDDKVAIKVAEMLMSDDPKVLQRGYKIITGNPVMRDALRRASDVGIRQIINYARPSGVASGVLALAEHLRPGESPHHAPDDYYGDQGQQGATPQVVQ